MNKSQSENKAWQAVQNASQSERPFAQNIQHQGPGGQAYDLTPTGQLPNRNIESNPFPWKRYGVMTVALFALGFFLWKRGG